MDDGVGYLASLVLQMVVFTIALGVICILIGVGQAIFEWPTWVSIFILDTIVTLFWLSNAIYNLVLGQPAGAVIFGAMTGYCAWQMYDNWRKNRKHKKPLGRYFGQRIINLGYKLKVVPT